MRALQWEVGQVMTESGLAHPCDFGVAPQVLGVAAAALAGGRLSHVPVKTAFAPEIRGNLLVTREAQSILPLAIGEIVTLRAFGLDCGVRLGDRPGHDELLDAGCIGARGGRQRNTHENERSRVVE